MHKENMLAMPPSGAVQCRVVLWTLAFCTSLMIGNHHGLAFLDVIWRRMSYDSA